MFATVGPICPGTHTLQVHVRWAVLPICILHSGDLLLYWPSAVWGCTQSGCDTCTHPRATSAAALRPNPLLHTYITHYTLQRCSRCLVVMLIIAFFFPLSLKANGRGFRLPALWVIPQFAKVFVQPSMLGRSIMASPSHREPRCPRKPPPKESVSARCRRNT